MTSRYAPDDQIAVAFVVEGKWIRLSTEERWLRAIRAGDLRPDTEVEVELHGQVVSRTAAASVPHLQKLFEALAPPRPSNSSPTPAPEAPTPERPPPSPPETAADSDDSGPWSLPKSSWPSQDPLRAAASAEEPASQAVTDEQQVDQPSERGAEEGATSVAPALQPKSGGAGCFWIVVVILLLGFLLSRCGSSSDPFSTDPQQVFVRVNTSAYSEMSEAVTNREPLMRGASLSVIQGADETDGADWAKIVHGPLKDRYVRKSALSAREPPDLVRLIGQTWTVGPVQVNVREEPSASAAALTQLAPATRLTVVGVTANGWAEVTLPTGAAAYVHARLLRAPAPAKETVILSSPPLAERPRTAAASPAVPDPQENSPAGRGESGSPPADDNRPTVITSPDWLRRPSGEEVARYYPDRAMRLGLEGRAVLSCEVSAAGVLVDCSVTSEEPADGGFGEAALRMTRLFKMRPMTRDGRLVGGSRVRIPINFRLPNGGT